MIQTPLFSDSIDRAAAAAPGARRALPTLGEEIGTQKDIRYVAAASRSVLNGPETTGMGYWSVNPYVGCAFGCAYCYARYAHRYVMERLGGGEATAVSLADDTGGGGSGSGEAPMPSWLAFERRIFVKQNAPALLRAALRRHHGPHSRRRVDSIVVGTATDPYQPAERRFRVTRGVLESLAELSGLRVAIITKSPLVTRDVDVLARLASRSTLTVHVSLITLDRELARRIEPRSPTPESRLRAIGRLREAGIDVGVNVMPVLPGITDRPSDLEALVRAIAAAGATAAGACALRLRSDARKRYLAFIEAEFPALASRYRASYAHGHQVGDRYRDGLRRTFARLCERYGIESWGRRGDDEEDDDEGDETPNELGSEAASGGQQLTLDL
ncbi:MAG TPA: radical SAM protein [Gemmatimonadaceae bacterium]|nr:radical SAM protein [Gemmatimonadaceae bacterium]